MPRESKEQLGNSTSGQRLSEVGDVKLSGVSDGHVLTYDATLKQWKNATGGGGASALNDLSDVTITTPSNGEVLKYNGSAWVNDTVSGTGDVVGPASATDNALVRFDLATGKLIQNSGVTLNDSEQFAGVDKITFAGGGTSNITGLKTIQNGVGLITISPFNFAGDGEVKITNSSNATILTVGTDTVSGSTLVVDRIKSLQATTPGPLTLDPEDGVVSIEGADKLQFRDSAIYINSPTDGNLDIIADGTIEFTCNALEIDCSGSNVSVNFNSASDRYFAVTNAGAGIAGVSCNEVLCSVIVSTSTLTIDGGTNDDVTITADGTGRVILNNLEERFRTRRVPFVLGYPQTGDYVIPYTAGNSTDGAKAIYGKIIRVMAVTKGTSATCKFNVHVRNDDDPEGGGAVDNDLFTATNEPSASNTRAEWDSGDTGWTSASTEVDAANTGSANDCVVIEVMITSNNPTKLIGWLEILENATA